MTFFMTLRLRRQLTLKWISKSKEKGKSVLAMLISNGKGKTEDIGNYSSLVSWPVCLFPSMLHSGENQKWVAAYLKELMQS